MGRPLPPTPMKLLSKQTKGAKKKRSASAHAAEHVFLALSPSDDRTPRPSPTRAICTPAPSDFSDDKQVFEGLAGVSLHAAAAAALGGGAALTTERELRARAALALLPYWCRFWQCARRACDERRADHIVNAGKYLLSMLAVVAAHAEVAVALAGDPGRVRLSIDGQARTDADASLFPAGTYFLCGVFVVSVLLGKSPLYLLSGLTALTAVLLLIFRDAILGLVAGIQLSVNRMVARGDWIEMPKYGADGDDQCRH